MTTSIDFCHSTTFKIDNAQLKEKVLNVCDSLFGFTLKRNYFPGPQPVTIERKDIDLLKKNEYMVCEKSDGERYVMLLINIDQKPMCFMINRNNDFYFMDLSFKKEVFEGSIFDGELIKTKAGDWNYLIHDCMIYNGTDFTKQPHNLRYACIIDFIVKRYVSKKTDCFNIKTKIFYHYGNLLDQTWNHIFTTTENKIDGLIFTSVNGPIKFGRDYSLLKWKEPDNHTMDLLVKLKTKKLYLYGTNNYLFKLIDSKNKNYPVINEYLAKNKISDGIIEFKYSVKDEIFTPYRLRLDKDKPNGEITITNTLKNITEALKVCQLI